MKYGWDQPDCRDEDSPAQLLSYRREYAAAFASLHLPKDDYSIDDTKLSPILEAIEIAVEDTICRPWIIKKLLEFGYDGNVPFTFREFCDAWLKGQAEDWTRDARRVFGPMWHGEEAL